MRSGLSCIHHFALTIPEFMLTHIVIWKYRSEVSQAEREAHAARLRALPGVIPEIVSFVVGFDVLRLPRSYDLGLVAVFRERAGLDAYTDHPQHQEVAALGRELAEHVASVDFEDENRNDERGTMSDE
ncbi:hypothetical protein BH18ACI2_BH18ACI2_18650 [soil metagenome]